VKTSEYFICLSLAVVALALAILVFFTSRSAQTLQDQLAAQQGVVSEEVNKGSLSQQVGAKLLQDTAQVALTAAAPAPAKKN
jgi:cell division protein YceG involved in septum cleavage